MDEHLERWLVEADEDERTDAIIEFEGSVELRDVSEILAVNGVIISGSTDMGGGALVNVSPAGLREIMDEDWVASVVQPPPGTGEPGHPGADLEDLEIPIVRPQPGTGERERPGEGLVEG